MTEERPPGPNADNPPRNEPAQLPAPLRVRWGVPEGRQAEPQRVWVEDRIGETDLSSPDARARQINRLGLLIQALGLVSIALGLSTVPFIWPKVRLLWLIGLSGMGIFSGLAGVFLRGLHHSLLYRLGREAGGVRLYRTKVQRCRAGMFLSGLMLAAGVTLERAVPNLGKPAAENESAEAQDQPRLARGLKVEVVRPRQMYAQDDLRLRVARASVQPGSDGEQPRLLLLLEASNAGRATKLDFDRMQDIELPLLRMAYLTDDLQNRYQAVERPELVGGEDQSGPTALYPGDRLRVRLVFERPVARARLLRLTVPADSFRLMRPVVLEIDARDLDTPKPATPKTGR